jgi:hypothetical protein
VSTLFTDNFNRANGGAGANYTDLLGALNIVSNKFSGSGGDWVSRVDGGSVPASNCWGQFVVSTIPASGDALNLYLRTNLGTNNGYAIIINNTLARFVRADAGVTTTIGAGFSLPSAGQAVRFSFSSMLSESCSVTGIPGSNTRICAGVLVLRAAFVRRIPATTLN